MNYDFNGFLMWWPHFQSLDLMALYLDCITYSWSVVHLFRKKPNIHILCTFTQILDETGGKVNLSLQWTRYFEFRVLQIVANGWKWFGCTLPQNFFGTFVLWGFPLEALVPSVPRGQNSANVSSEWLSSASGTIQHLTHPRIHIFVQIKICKLNHTV